MALILHGQYGPEAAVDARGRLLKDTNVYVFQNGTSTLATLYETRFNTNPVVNPIVTSAIGNVTFVAAPGSYDLSLTNPATDITTVVVEPDSTGVWVFTAAGQMFVRESQVRLYIEEDTTVFSIRASVGSPPTGAPAIFDVNKNGSTIFTNQANRPTIAPGDYTGFSGTPDITNLSPGDYLTIDIDQVGTVVPGIDLTINIRVH